MIRAEFSGILLLQNQSRRGFAANHNQVLRIASGEHIILLNEDTVVHEGTIEYMLRFAESQSNLGAVGCRVELDALGLELQAITWRRFPSPFFDIVSDLIAPALRKLPRLDGIADWIDRWSDASLPLPESRTFVTHFSAPIMLIPRSTISRIGFLDERYYIYLEETDWFLRMKKSGFQIAYLPEVSIFHHFSGSMRRVPERDDIFLRSYAAYCRKHHGRLGLLLHRLDRALVQAASRWNSNSTGGEEAS